MSFNQIDAINMINKTIFILVVAISVNYESFCQITDVGIGFGGNISRVYGSGLDGKSDFQFGTQIGLKFKYRITPIFSLKSGFEMSNKEIDYNGSKYNESDYYGYYNLLNRIAVKTNFYSLKMPIIGSLNLKRVPNLDLNIGMYIEHFWSVQSVSNEINLGKQYRDYQYNNNDFGVVFGVENKFKLSNKFSTGLFINGNFGLNNMVNETYWNEKYNLKLLYFDFGINFFFNR